MNKYLFLLIVLFFISIKVFGQNSETVHGPYYVKQSYTLINFKYGTEVYFDTDKRYVVS